METGTDPYNKILRLPNGLSGHGYNSRCYGYPQLHSPINRREGGHIKHRAVRTDRKLTRRNLPSGQRLNQLFFRALGITGGQHRQFDSGILRKESVHLGNCFLFIVLHRKNCPLGLQSPAQNPHSPQHLFRICSEQRIVRRNIGLTFAGVGDEGIHLPDGGKRLHVSRESRATHAYDSCLPDNAENRIRVHRFGIFTGHPGWDGCILKIIFDYNSGHHSARRMGPGLHGNYSPGN